MDILQRMRQAVRQQNYRLSSHANDEMADDWLTSVDIEEIIRTGTIADKFMAKPGTNVRLMSYVVFCCLVLC